MFLNQLPLIMVIAIFTLPLDVSSSEEKLRFAVVPKGVGNEFFLDAKKGCEKAAADLVGVECLYDGSEKSDARAQSGYVKRLIEEGVDGIAIAVIHSEILATRGIQKARESKIPVITFDSDFTEKVRIANPELRSSYVGTDNFQFGWELGEITRQLKPEGGKLCLISGHQSGAGLQKRVNGVRAALAGIKDTSRTIKRLDGQNGWTEYFRCPFYSNELPDRALSQLLFVLQKNKLEPDLVDTIISVGAWPQQNEGAYRKALEPYKEALDQKQVVVIMGDAMILQRRLLSENLAHANIGQNPFQMGYVAIELLYKLVQGKQVPEIVHTPLIRCLPDRKHLCSE